MDSFEVFRAFGVSDFVEGGYTTIEEIREYFKSTGRSSVVLESWYDIMANRIIARNCG